MRLLEHTTLGASLVTAVVVIATPTTAQATPSASEPLAVTVRQVDSAPDAARKGYDRCPRNHLCLFTGKGGSGTMAYFERGSHDLGEFGMDNRTTSVWNRTGRYMKAYDHRNYHDRLGSAIPHIKFNLVARADNRITSFKLVR